MAIRVGLNPSGKLYVGPMGGAGKATGTGDVPIRLEVAGEAVRRVVGSGAIVLKALAVDVIAVHPRIARGPGDIVLPKLATTGSSANTQHPNGSGEVPLRLTVSGTAIRKVGVVPYYDAVNVAVPLRLVVSGEGIISRRYITGSGAISLGSMTVKDVTPVNTTRVVQIEGVFADADIEGVFSEFSDIEGADER